MAGSQYIFSLCLFVIALNIHYTICFKPADKVSSNDQASIDFGDESKEIPTEEKNYIRILFDVMKVEMKNLNWSLHLQIEEVKTDVKKLKGLLHESVKIDDESNPEIDANFEVRNDTYCHDKEMNSFLAGPTLCKKTCKLDADCKGVVHWAEKKSCYKRSLCNAKDLRYYPGLDTYIRQGKTFKKFENKFCPDGEMNAFHATANVCKRVCHQDEECKAVVHWPGQNACYKRYQCKNKEFTPYPGIDTYVKKDNNMLVGNMSPRAFQRAQGCPKPPMTDMFCKSP